MGRVTAAPAKTSGGNVFERDGRICCGSSCAPSGEKYSGTVGAFGTDGNRMLAISNNHVFGACNHTQVGTPILSPSAMDARPSRRAPMEICTHERIVELRSGHPGLVQCMKLDASAALVSNPERVSSWQGTQADGYDTPENVSQPSAGLQVKKVGRTTGLTTGVVEALVPTPWILPYKSKNFNATVWFVDTWTVRSTGEGPFALAGDSGSLVVTEDETSAVGLIFAGSEHGYSIMMSLDQVLVALGVGKLISGHGC